MKALLAGAGLIPIALFAQTPADESQLEAEIRASSEEHMRLELGVNDITTPSIAGILNDLGIFRPVPLALIDSNDLEATYPNRMQTALHVGTLVADGFMLTIAERPDGIQDVGRALIRQSRALGVGDRLAQRSKSLFELSGAGNWPAMREELIRTQGDVEQAMLDLHDEEMAHMVSLGGWIRGFQLAVHATEKNYTPERAAVLGRTEILDYYLDRLDTLHPRLKKTEFARRLTETLANIRSLIGEAGGTPGPDQITQLLALADAATSIALAPVDPEGNLMPTENL